MLLTILSLLLTSPTPCLGMETAEWRACQPKVINLGTWDPRPLDITWTDYPAPEKYGEYATEKKADAR